MKTGAQYRQSLLDGRATYIDGERVDDPGRHPLFKTPVDNVADSYDHAYSTEPNAFNSSCLRFSLTPGQSSRMLSPMRRFIKSWW